MIFMGYTIVYEIDTQKQEIIIFTIFNQNKNLVFLSKNSYFKQDFFHFIANISYKAFNKWKKYQGVFVLCSG